MGPRSLVDGAVGPEFRTFRTEIARPAIHKTGNSEVGIVPDLNYSFSTSDPAERLNRFSEK